MARSMNDHMRCTAKLRNQDNQAYFSFEIHNNLQVANVSLKILRKSTKCVSISVRKDELQFSFCDNIAASDEEEKRGFNYVCFEANEDFSFIPSSLSGLEGLITHTTHEKGRIYLIEKNISEISFRIQLQVAVEHCQLISNSNANGHRGFKTFPVSFDTSAKHHLLCVLCHKHLICDLKFSRTVELPTEGWEEMASEWFCHQHGESETQGTSLSSDQSCLYTDSLNFFVRENLMDGSAICKEQDDTLRCPRCLVDVGKLRKLRAIDPCALYFAFSKHRVAFDTSQKITQSVNSLFEFLLVILENEMDSTLSSRLCLEYKASDLCILLWIMDKNHQRFLTSVDIGQERNQVITIEPQRTIKVLYSAASRNSDLCQCWLKDSCVETQSLQETSFWEVLNALIQSTHTVPVSHQNADGFYIGFIAV